MSSTEKTIDLGNDVFFLPAGGRNSAILTFASPHDGLDSISGSYVSKKQASKPWYPHGENNLMPNELVALIWDNPLKPELLATQSAFIAGRGVNTFRKEIVEGKKKVVSVEIPEISKFFRAKKIKKVIHAMAKNLEYFNNVYVEVILTKAGRIASLRVIDSTFVRAEWMNPATDRIENYYICGDWKKPKYSPTDQAGNVTKVPAYDPENPKKHSKFILHLKDETPGNPYYGVPNWYGTRNWTKVANKIPLWHLSGMENGYNIRWHIQAPNAYIDRFTSEEEKKKAKEDLRDDLNKWLAGTENVGKAFLSWFKTDATGKMMDGWKIEPVTSELHDEAFTKLFDQSLQADSAGHGINPTLAGIMVQGKLSSGSEMRLSYLIHMALKTTIPRETLLDAFEMFRTIEGWSDDFEFAFEDIEFTTLDVNPTGSQKVTSA